jgi:hypothetical protein
MGADFFHTDNITKLRVAFKNLANAPKNKSLNAVEGKSCSFCHIHTKHINTLCEYTVEVFNVKPGGAHSKC